MKRKGLIYLGILVVFFGVGFVLTGTVQAAEKKEVTIGYAVSLTGRSGVEGSETQRSYQLWLEQINKAGGLQVGDKRYPVKFVSYDDESDASTCVKFYEKLITGDKVDLILSPWGSGNNFAASAVAEKYRYPIIMSSASAISIWERGFKYIFETTPLSPTMVEPWISFLKAYKEIKTAAILYENFLFTVALNESLSKYVQEAGVKLLLDEKYPLSGKDFTGILLKVKQLNPDAFFVLNIMPSSVYATRQAHEVGVTPKLLMVNIGPHYTEEFIGGLGDLSEKVYESGFWHPNLPFPGVKDFVRDIKAKFGKEPSSGDIAFAYMSCQILEQVIKKAGTIDREKVAQTLHKEKFETIGGPYEYDERGINKVQRGFICQVQKKKRVIVWPTDLTEAKPEFLR